MCAGACLSFGQWRVTLIPREAFPSSWNLHLLCTWVTATAQATQGEERAAIQIRSSTVVIARPRECGGDTPTRPSWSCSQGRASLLDGGECLSNPSGHSKRAVTCTECAPGLCAADKAIQCEVRAAVQRKLHHMQLGAFSDVRCPSFYATSCGAREPGMFAPTESTACIASPAGKYARAASAGCTDRMAGQSPVLYGGAAYCEVCDAESLR